MRGEQAIFNLEIKKKSGFSINPDIHHSKVFSSVHSKSSFKYHLFQATLISSFISWKSVTLPGIVECPYLNAAVVNSLKRVGLISGSYLVCVSSRSNLY